MCWQLAGKLRNIIVFNGDTDPSVQMRGTEAAVSSFDLKATEEWRPWFYKPEETSQAVLVREGGRCAHTFLRSACGSHAARDWVVVTLHLALALAVARLVRYELSA